MNKKDMVDIRIISGCTATNKTELFSQLAETAFQMNPAKEAGLSVAEIIAALQAREEESSTEIEKGLVFPHARMEQVKELIVIFALMQTPLVSEKEYSAPVKLACMMLIPAAYPMQALKFMSSVANCLKNKDSKEHMRLLLKEGNVQELTSLLNFSEKRILCAGDLMRPWHCALSADMKLQEATRQMLVKNAQVTPVLDSNGVLVGELACHELFKLGIPDFFSQLKSVGFIRYFDPFENYFAMEAKSTVGDVMTRSIQTFPEDATLIEIVFAMVVQKVPLIYIVNANGVLRGVIDETVLLERIINL